MPVDLADFEAVDAAPAAGPDWSQFEAADAAPIKPPAPIAPPFESPLSIGPQGPVYKSQQEAEKYGALSESNLSDWQKMRTSERGQKLWGPTPPELEAMGGNAGSRVGALPVVSSALPLIPMGIGGAAGKMLMGYFAAHLLSQQPEVYRTAKAAADKGDWSTFGKIVGEDAFGAAMTALGLRGVMTEGGTGRPPRPNFYTMNRVTVDGVTPAPGGTGQSLQIPEGYNPRPKVQPPRPVVPGEPAESRAVATPEQEAIIEEQQQIKTVRAAKAMTKAQVQALFPDMNRQQAAQLREKAWGKLVTPPPSVARAAEAVQAQAGEVDFVGDPTSELSPEAQAAAADAFKTLAERRKVPGNVKPPKSAPVKPTPAPVTEATPAELQKQLDAELGQEPPPEGGAPVPVPKPTPKPTAPANAAAEMKSTEDAQKAGLAATGVDQLEAWAAQRRAVIEKQNELMKLAKAEPDKAKQAALLNQIGMLRTQIPREAIETATNTGSAVEGVGNSPASKLGKRPLDWKGNPEVADWLRKNGEALGIKLPDEFKAPKAAAAPAPSAAPSAAPIKLSPEDVSWAKGTKMVDPTGKPMVLYRGDREAGHAAINAEGQSWWTPNRKQAAKYSKSGKVHAAILNVKNIISQEALIAKLAKPLRDAGLAEDEVASELASIGPKEMVAKAKELGYDALRMRIGELSGEPEIHVFSPEQVRLIEAAPVAPTPAPAAAPVAPVLKQEAATPPVVQQKAPFSPKAAKAQKKFLFAEVDKALDEAPEIDPKTRNDDYMASPEAQDLKAAKAWVSANPWPERLKMTPAEWEAASKEWIAKSHQELAELAQKYKVNPNVSAPSEIEVAARNAYYARQPHVTIDIPGDGTFSILNHKDALKEFKAEHAGRFPTTAPKGKTPSTMREGATSAAPIGDLLDASNVAKTAATTASTEPTRKIINYLWSDGQQTVATDGRRLIIIDQGLGGTTKKPQLFHPDGKPLTAAEMKEAGNFPNHKQVIPQYSSADAFFKGVDTGRMFTILRQAQEAVSEKSKTVKLWKNPDGSYGMTSGSEGISYEHNVQPDAKLLVALDPQYFIDAVNAARRMGSEKVDILGKDEVSPIIVKGKGVQTVIMPMRIDGPARSSPTASMKPAPTGGIGGGIQRAMQQGRQGEAGFVTIPKGVEAVLDRVAEGAKDLPAGIRNAWRSASMQSLPRITDANRLAGEAGVRLDASRTVARAKGIEFAGKVTEGVKDKTFDLKFGTALTEDNLRDLKRQHEERARTAKDPAEALAAQTQADAVSTMIGQPNSPFKTEADYQKFMRTPEAQQALAKHIELWQSDKDPIFRQAMDLDPDQPLPTRGAQFGGRVNLKNVQRDQGTKTTVGPNVRGSLIRATATLKRKDPFGRQAKGSGSYEGSYQEIMANGFEREYPVAKQHEFIKELIKGGDAKLSKREFDPEAEIKGESTKGYPLKMKPWSGQYLQIRKSLAPEYEDVSGLSAAVRAGPYSAVADALTKSSIMGLSEGSTHAGNLLTQVFTGLGPSSNPLINAVVKTHGRTDLLYSLPKVIINAFSDRKADMLKLAEIGAAKAPYRGAIGWFITKIDKGVRLYSADVYKGMAKKGWVEDTETGLREYVNQVGQYSKRLQPRWIQVLRSTGIQPFATAMQNFNVQGLRTMVAAPGAKAPTNLAALALRADKAAGILGFAVVVTALNYLVSGEPAGPKGTKLGAIGWIGDDDKLHQFDVGMLTGFTRGARITGAQGYVEAKRSGLGTGSAMLAGAQGVGNTAISSLTGPANRFGFMAITGKRPSIPPVQEAPVAVPQAEEDFSVLKSQVAKNVMEALKQANPVVDAAVRLKQGKYEEAATRQLSRYTPRTGMATETIEALPKIVAAGELKNYTDALAKEAKKQPLGYDRNTFIRERLDDDNIDPALRAKAMQQLQMKGIFKYE